MTRPSRILALLVPALLAGCCGPNKANIALRKQNQELRNQIAEMERRHVADMASIQAVQLAPSVETLPQARLSRLFTTHSLQLGRLTGGADFDPKSPGEEGVKVYAVPLDEESQKLKAGGAFEIELFDLAAEGNQKLGRWTFSPEKSRECWNGVLGQYTYVLPIRWDKVVPQRSDLTVKVTFVDELTGRRFTEQRVIHIKPPPATAPSTQPTSNPAP